MGCDSSISSSSNERFLYPVTFLEIRSQFFASSCSRNLQVSPNFFRNRNQREIVLPSCYGSKFEIKYTFPIIPLCFDGENVDFLVGCDYYFINKQGEIGYLCLTYKEGYPINPDVKREIQRPVEEMIPVEKRMLKIAKLLFEPTEKCLFPKVYDLNSDLPKFFEFKKNLLENNYIIFDPPIEKCSFTMHDKICMDILKPPKIVPKESHLKEDDSMKIVEFTEEIPRKIKKYNKDQRKYMKIEDENGNQDQSLLIGPPKETDSGSNDDYWEYQDYRPCFDPIPKKDTNYFFQIVNTKQKKGIESDEEYYNPVVAFRGVFEEIAFFYYGTSLFAVSKTGKIAEAGMVVFPFSYCPCYTHEKFRKPSNLRERILVHKIKKLFSKSCIYQKTPANYKKYQDTGLRAFGIESACYLRFDFIPMGDIIRNDDFYQPRKSYGYDSMVDWNLSGPFSNEEDTIIKRDMGVCQETVINNEVL